MQKWEASEIFVPSMEDHVNLAGFAIVIEEASSQEMGFYSVTEGVYIEEDWIEGFSSLTKDDATSQIDFSSMTKDVAI
jgi:hypothetical protein